MEKREFIKEMIKIMDIIEERDLKIKDFEGLRGVFPSRVKHILNYNSMRDYFDCYVALENGEIYRVVELYDPNIHVSWKYKEMSSSQMSCVVSFYKESIKNEIKREEELKEIAKKEKSIEELEKECESVANDILKKYNEKNGTKLRARLCVGKRGCDSKEYRALCVEYYGKVFGVTDWNYYFSAVFYKDKYGFNWVSYRKPLCGECYYKFRMEDFHQVIEGQAENFS
jgi:hypothetical protein